MYDQIQPNPRAKHTFHTYILSDDDPSRESHVYVAHERDQEYPKIHLK